MKKQLESISRRKFFRDTSYVLGSLALASITGNSACKRHTTTTKSLDNVNPFTTTNNINISATTLVNFVYIPPSDLPTLLDAPNCISKVADDRLFSIDGVWVKKISSEYAVLGITDKLQMMMGKIQRTLIFPAGTILEKDTPFCSIEANKIHVDPFTLVSGTIVQVNTTIFSAPTAINSSPYTTGWIVVIRLSQIDELADLLKPEEYVALISKSTKS